MGTCNRLVDRKISRADERESDLHPIFPPGVLLKTLSFLPSRCSNRKWQSKATCNDDLSCTFIVCSHNNAHKQPQNNELISAIQVFPCSGQLVNIQNTLKLFILLHFIDLHLYFWF